MTDQKGVDMFKVQGRTMKQQGTVQDQLALVDRAGMMALPVRLDLVAAAASAFDVVEWDRECESVPA